MNRRRFLKAGALVGVGLTLPGVGQRAASAMPGRLAVIATHPAGMAANRVAVEVLGRNESALNGNRNRLRCPPPACNAASRAEIW